MSTSAGRTAKQRRVSGQKIMQDRQDSRLTLLLQNLPDSPILLEMAESEREAYFDRLIQLVLLDGTEQ
jgi:hypothetical protein